MKYRKRTSHAAGPSSASQAALKAVIYARVSDPKQKTEGHGLESQETRCREFASYKGYEVVEVFRDDMSGAYAGRPGMLAMLSYLKRRKADPHVVVIDDISRLARGLDAHLKLRTAISEAGGILQSPSIEFGEDSDSILVENLLASVSQHQRQKNGEQTTNRMRARAMAGYWCFPAPIGYVFKKVQGHGKLMVRDEPIATVLQEAMEGFASGRFEIISQVARFLKAHPLYPAGRRSVLASERVFEIFTRPLYAGYITIPDWGINLVPAKHEPIISFETFKAIQDKMKVNAYAPRRRDINEEFPLRRYVTCGGCGHELSGCFSRSRNGTSHPYYLCQQKGCTDYGKSIRRDVVHGHFEELLRDLRPSSESFAMLSAMFRDLWSARAETAQKQAGLMQDEVKKLDRSAAQYVERLLDAQGGAVVKAYENRIQAIEEEKALLREKIARCGRPARGFDETFRTALNFLARPDKLWETKRIEDQRTVVKLVFAEKLSYQRGEGFRTAVTSSPFRILSSLKGGEEMMVPRGGIEPPTLRFSVACSTN